MVDYIRDNFAIWAKYQNRPMSEGWERFAERTVGIDDDGLVVYKNNEAAQVEDNAGAPKDLYGYDNAFGGITFGDTGVPTRIHANEWHNLKSYDGDDLRTILSYAGAASVDRSVAYYSTSTGEWVLGHINAMHDHDDRYVNTSGGDTMQGNLVVETNNIVISGGALQIGTGGGVHDIQYGTGLAIFNKSGTANGGVTVGYGGNGYMLEDSSQNDWVVAQAVADSKLEIGSTDWAGITFRTASAYFGLYYYFGGAYRNNTIAPTLGWTSFDSDDAGQLLVWSGTVFDVESQQSVLFRNNPGMLNGIFLQGYNSVGDTLYDLIGIKSGANSIVIGNSTDKRPITVYGPNAGSVEFDGTSVRLQNTYKYIIEAADESAVVVLEITSGDIFNIGESGQKLDTVLSADEFTLDSNSISKFNQDIQFVNYRGIMGTETGAPYDAYTLIDGYNNTVRVGDVLHQYPVRLYGSVTRPQYDGGSGLVDLALYSDLGGGGSGGPWLPLTAGIGEALTGILYLDAPGPALYMRPSASATQFGKISSIVSASYFEHFNPVGSATINITPRPASNSGGDIHMFRHTTAQWGTLAIYKGDGTATLQHDFRIDTGDVRLCQQGGALAVNRVFQQVAPDATVVHYLVPANDWGTYGQVSAGYKLLWLKSIAETGNPEIRIDASPMDGAGSSTQWMYRETTTTGVRRLKMAVGDGSDTIQHQFDMGVGDVDLCMQGGQLSEGGNDVLTEGANEFAALGTVTINQTDRLVFEDASNSWNKKYGTLADILAWQTFLVLGDTPASYVGYGLYAVQVAAGETQLSYANVADCYFGGNVRIAYQKALQFQDSGGVAREFIKFAAGHEFFVGRSDYQTYLQSGGTGAVICLDHFRINSGFDLQLGTLNASALQQHDGTTWRNLIYMDGNTDTRVGNAFGRVVLESNGSIRLKGLATGIYMETSAGAFSSMFLIAASTLSVGNTNRDLIALCNNKIDIVGGYLEMNANNIDMSDGYILDSGYISLLNNRNLYCKETVGAGGAARNAVHMNASNGMMFGDVNNKVIVRGESVQIEGIVVASSGPTTSQFNTGRWGVFRNTTTNATWCCANYGGTLYKVRMWA